MELEDFHGSELSLDDFQAVEKQGISLSQTSAANIAGSVVLKSPETMNSESYKKLRDQLQTPQGRSDFVRNDMLSNSIAAKYGNNIDEVLLDEELTDEQKGAVIGMIRGDVPEPVPSTLLELAQASAFENPDNNESEEQALGGVLDALQGVVESRRQRQSLINSFALANDPGALDKLVDFGEYLLPLAESIQLGQLQEDFGIDKDLLAGGRKEELFAQIEKLPVAQRAAFTEQVLELINNNDTLVGADGNFIHSIDILEGMSGNSDYSDLEKWTDNMINVLDVVGMGWLVKTAVKPTKAAKAANTVAKARVHAVTTDVKPAAPSQIVKETSPDKARAMHVEAATDESGEMARTLYGTTRDEAVVKDFVPEVEVVDGTVPNKVMIDGRRSEEPYNTKRQRKLDGQAYLPEADIIRARRKFVESFSRVEGFIHQAQHMTVKTLDSGATLFRTMYRPVDSGWKSADEALESAAFALRDYGVDPAELTLYRRTGDEWVETTQKELAARKALRDEFSRKKKKIPEELKEIDYAVGINVEWKANPQDIVATEPWKIGKISNFLDRLPPGLSRLGQGSLQQHVLDPASYLPPELTRPAAAAIDRSFKLRKEYVDQFKEKFLVPRSKLSKEDTAAIDDYIREANLEEIPFSRPDLYARGFNSSQIEALEGWRRSMDALWYATNADLAQSIKASGFKIFKDGQGSHLMVKPVDQSQVSHKMSFYSTVDDDMVKFTKEELDELYANGGTIARFQEPTKIGDEYVETIVVRNTPEAGYLRSMKDDEPVLQYRDGYYPVMYDANFFIDRTVKTKGGQTVRKTVASARTEEEALSLQKMLQSKDPDADFLARPDRAQFKGRGSQMNQTSWDIAVSSGMTNQRIRGERLIDAGSDLHKAGHSNLVDPVEAVSKQIMMVSERVSMRPYLEAVKKRWIDQYFDELNLPMKEGAFGEKYFPATIEELKRMPGVSQKTVADARSTFNYIHHLENGFGANVMDEMTKAMLNYGAELASSLPVAKKAEGWLRGMGQGSPSQAMRGAAFKLYLAANPGRQLLIQAHQSVQLTALAPGYIAGGGLVQDIYRISAARMGMKVDDEALKMLEEMNRSGMSVAVDANNMIRQKHLSLADKGVGAKALDAVGSPLRLAQRVGFDSGEQIVLETAWLTQYHLAKQAKKGQKLTRRDYDEIAGKARAFTYDMNKAGDMPYNQNTLSVILQFLQVPHKAMLQPFLNRSLTPAQRARLFTWNTIMYGVPSYALGSWFYNTVPEGPLRDSVQYGFEDVLFNGIASGITGEDQNLDFGDLSPVNAYGLSQTLHGMFTSDIVEMVANSPSGSLLFGGNARITEAFKTATKWMIPTTNYDDPDLAVTFTDVSLSFANLFSGASNAFKGAYAYENGKHVSSLGTITDPDVTHTEALAKALFGLSTREETSRREFNEWKYGDKTKAFEPSDVGLWYNELKRMLNRRGQHPREVEIAQMVMAEGYRVFGYDKPLFRQELEKLVAKDLEDTGYNIYEEMRKSMNLQNSSEVRKRISMLPESEYKEALMKALDGLDGAMGVLEEMEENREK